MKTKHIIAVALTVQVVLAALVGCVLADCTGALNATDIEYISAFASRISAECHVLDWQLYGLVDFLSWNAQDVSNSTQELNALAAQIRANTDTLNCYPTGQIDGALAGVHLYTESTQERLAEATAYLNSIKAQLEATQTVVDTVRSLVSPGT